MAITPIGVAGVPHVGGVAGVSSAGPSADVPFAKMIDQFLGEANAKQTQMDQAVQQLAMGKTNNVHDVILAVAQADLSFRMVLEIRNRLTEAYQEIMRMQM